MNNATTETVRGIGTLNVYIGQADATGLTACRVVPVSAEGDGGTVRVSAEAASVAQYGETLALAFAAAETWRESTRIPLWASRELAAE